MDLDRREKAGMSPCGLSGFCAGALSSAWVGRCENTWVCLWVWTLGLLLWGAGNASVTLFALSAFHCKATSTQQLPNFLPVLLLEHALCLKASLSYPRSLAELCYMAKEPTQKRKLITFSLHLKFCLQTSNWDHGIPFLFGFECSLVVLDQFLTT